MSMMMTELDVQSKCAVTSNIVFWSASILCFLLDRFILSPKTLQEQKVQGNKNPGMPYEKYHCLWHAL